MKYFFTYKLAFYAELLLIRSSPAVCIPETQHYLHDIPCLRFVWLWGRNELSFSEESTCADHISTRTKDKLATEKGGQAVCTGLMKLWTQSCREASRRANPALDTHCDCYLWTDWSQRRTVWIGKLQSFTYSGTTWGAYGYIIQWNITGYDATSSLEITDPTTVHIMWKLRCCRVTFQEAGVGWH